MTTAVQVVNHALSFVGVTEDPPNTNCNPFSHYLGRPCHFWCADFTVAVLKQQGVPIPPGADTASTRANKAAWIKAGRWVHPSKIREGDVIFFHTSDRNGKDRNIPSHTGIATGRPRTRQPSVDGNTSRDHDTGSGTENGGEVAVKNRLVSVVIGAGRPDYAIAPPPINRPQPQEDDEMPFIARPVTDNDPGEYFVNGDTYVPLASLDEKQQLLNSGFQVKDLEPLAWAIFRATATEVPHP